VIPTYPSSTHTLVAPLTHITLGALWIPRGISYLFTADARSQFAHFTKRAYCLATRYQLLNVRYDELHNVQMFKQIT
jgi:hypothetical protein